MLNSHNLIPPAFGPSFPLYPPLDQAVRVTTGTVPGPSGYASSSLLAPNLYIGYVQQLDPRTVLPRDREPCLVLDLNGRGLEKGYYTARLAGSYHSLPVYEVGGPSIKEEGPDIIDDIFNYYNTTFNYFYGNELNFYNTNFFNIDARVSVLVEGSGTWIFDVPMVTCGWLFWCYVNYTITTSQINNWSLPANSKDGNAVVFRMLGGTFGLTGIQTASVQTSETNSSRGAAGAGWIDLGNIFNPDQLYTTTHLAKSATSGTVTLRDFDFNVPDDGVITGILVVIRRGKAVDDFQGTINDTTVQMLKANVASGTAKHSTLDWPAADDNLELGGVGDLWGLTLTPADVNDAGFGVTFNATEAGVLAIDLRVDVVTITIYYTRSHAGQVIAITPIEGDMTLTHEDTASLAANRLSLENSTSKTIKQYGIVLLWYDPASVRWRVFRQDDGGGSVTLESAEFSLASPMVVGAAPTWWTSDGSFTLPSVDLPEAGTYLLHSSVEGDIFDGFATGSYLEYELYDSTNAVHLDSRVVVQTTTTLFAVLHRATAALQYLRSASGAQTIQLRARVASTDPMHPATSNITKARITYLKISS